jgi:hypothetical protein
MASDYWFLLRSGIVQSVPCIAIIVRSTVGPHLSFNHPPQPSGKYKHKQLVAKQGKTWRETVNFAREAYLPYSVGIFNMP